MGPTHPNVRRFRPRTKTIDSGFRPGRIPHGLQQAQNGGCRRQEAEKEAAGRRATGRQILDDAEQPVTAWNERQAKRIPMLFSPTIGAAITTGYWFLRARRPA
jgi:hypothetical protein